VHDLRLHLSEAAAQRPQELRLLDALATLHRSRKRWDEAIAASDKAIAIAGPPQPEHWSLYYGRGIAHERAKNWPAAERDFKQALALLPPEPQDEAGKRNLAHVLNYLAYSWVDMGLNIEEAFTKLQRAVALQPRDGHIVDSLGWAYYRLGRYEDAVRELERAVELRPQDSVINDHLGDAYWKVGRRNEARFQWTHARDRNPEPEDLPKILRKLEHGLDVATPEAQRTDAPRPDGG
jgi:Flp pilus assembly protein TadD